MITVKGYATLSRAKVSWEADIGKEGFESLGRTVAAVGLRRPGLRRAAGRGGR